MILQSSGDAESFERTLSRIIPGVALLGFLVYLAYVVTRGSDSLAFYQIGIAVGMLVYLVTFMDMILGIAVLIACVGLSPEVSLAGLQNLRLEDFIVPGLLLGWLTRAARDRDRFAATHVKGPILAYFCSILVSTGLGSIQGTHDTVLALTIGAKYLEYFAIFLLLINTVKKEGEFRALVVLMILIALLSALMGSARIFGNMSATSARLSGPLGETGNIFGGYLILNLSILTGLFLHARTGPVRLITVLGMGALLTALLYTFSRASYVAFGVALLAFGVFKERRVILILMLIVVLVPLAAPDAITSRIGTIAGVLEEQGPSSYESRVYAWTETLRRVAQESPLLGFGLGSIELGWIDSEYYRALSDTGFLGLILFGWLLVRVFRVANRGYDSLPPGGFHKGYAAGYWIAFGSMVVHAVASTSFTSIRTMEMFILLTGLFVAQVNRRKEWNLEPYPEHDARDPKSDAATPRVF